MEREGERERVCVLFFSLCISCMCLCVSFCVCVCALFVLHLCGRYFEFICLPYIHPTTILTDSFLRSVKCIPFSAGRADHECGGDSAGRVYLCGLPLSGQEGGLRSVDVM